MLSRHAHGALTWLDLESPTTAEVQQVVNEFGVDSLVAEDILLPATKPRIDFYPEHLYVILHFPVLRGNRTQLEHEIDFVIGRDYIVTSHTEPVEEFYKFTQVLEVNSVLGRNAVGSHAGFLFYYMLKRLYRSVEHEIELVRRELARIEEGTFSGREASMVIEISKAARNLLNLRQTIEPHREILRSIESDAPQFFGADFAPYLRALSNEYYRVHNHIMRNTDALRELRETNNSLLTTKQNQVMKSFTMLALFTFPLTLIAAVFSMRSEYTPIIGERNDFWIIISIMSGTAALMYAYFRRKRWIQ